MLSSRCARSSYFKFFLLSNVSVDEEQGARFASGTANECGAAVDNDIPATFCNLLSSP